MPCHLPHLISLISHLIIIFISLSIPFGPIWVFLLPYFPVYYLFLILLFVFLTCVLLFATPLHRTLVVGWGYCCSLWLFCYLLVFLIYSRAFVIVLLPTTTIARLL